MWLIGGAIFYLILIVQSLLNFYSIEVDKAWSWALPVMLPTLMLMVGVHVAQAFETEKPQELVDPHLFWIVFGTSGFYITIVLLTLFLSPLSSESPFVLMQRSNFWLGPLQGLAAAAFGVFYVRHNKVPSAAHATPVDSPSPPPLG